MKEHNNNSTFVRVMQQAFCAVILESYKLLDATSCGPCPKGIPYDVGHQDVAQWQGESILGRALMRVRDTLRNEEA